jgi:hypothetical protein
MKKEFGDSSLPFSFLDKSIKINSRDTILHSCMHWCCSAQFPEERMNLGRGTDTERERERERETHRHVKQEGTDEELVKIVLVLIL